MFDDNTKFVAYNDLRWSGVLKAIPKSPNILQPLFEAFTNSLESIRLRQQNGDKFESYIKIIMDYNSTLDGKGVDLSSLTVIDFSAAIGCVPSTSEHRVIFTFAALSL